MARPTRYEREDVLEKAVQAFWDQGYCATSIARLVEATELQPGSLYAAFGSKEALFLEALDHYGARSAARIERFLSGAESPLDGVRHYLRQLAATVSNPRVQRSCLLVNTVLELAQRNKAVRAQVNRQFDMIEALFRRALEAAQARGELAPEKDPRALASFLMASIWGLRVLAGTGPAPERAHVVVDQLLQVLE